MNWRRGEGQVPRPRAALDCERSPRWPPRCDRDCGPAAAAGTLLKGSPGRRRRRATAVPRCAHCQRLPPATKIPPPRPARRRRPSQLVLDHPALPLVATVAQALLEPGCHAPLCTMLQHKHLQTIAEGGHGRSVTGRAAAPALPRVRTGAHRWAEPRPPVPSLPFPHARAAPAVGGDCGLRYPRSILLEGGWSSPELAGRVVWAARGRQRRYPPASTSQSLGHRSFPSDALRSRENHTTSARRGAERGKSTFLC